MAKKKDVLSRRRQVARTRRGSAPVARPKPTPPPPPKKDEKKSRLTVLWVSLGIVAVAIAVVLVAIWLSRRPSPAAQPTATIEPTPVAESTPVEEETVGKTWSQPPAMALDLSKDYRAIVKTEKGDFVIDLFEDEAPLTVNNFVFLAREGYYDGVTFHRVLAGFMAQTGDPTGTGRGGPGYSFADEFSPALRHDSAGIVSMANAGPNTNGSQFFITFVPTPHLDGAHAVFGKVVEGMDVVNAITLRNPDAMPAPPPGDKILTIEIVEE
jgi:cyclophilin family peptidyl-prolyl cis-trans isomerase